MSGGEGQYAGAGAYVENRHSRLYIALQCFQAQTRAGMIARAAGEPRIDYQSHTARRSWIFAPRRREKEARSNFNRREGVLRVLNPVDVLGSGDVQWMQMGQALGGARIIEERFDCRIAVDNTGRPCCPESLHQRV